MTNIVHSDIVTAFDDFTIGSKVTNPDGFEPVLVKAIEEHDFSTDTVPGQGFLVIPDAIPFVSAGDGPRTDNPEDYVPALHRGRVGLYLKRAKAGEGPTLIECKTYRYHGHSEHDKATYREDMELAEWKVKDPLVRFQSFLEELGILTDEWIAQTDSKIAASIDEAVTFAEESPYPEGSEALEDVFTPEGEESER